MDFLIVCDEIQVSTHWPVPAFHLRRCVRVCVCVSENGKHVQFCSIQTTAAAAKNVMLTTLLTHISSLDDFESFIHCIMLDAHLVHHHRHHHQQ